VAAARPVAADVVAAHPVAAVAAVDLRVVAAEVDDG